MICTHTLSLEPTFTEGEWTSYVHEIVHGGPCELRLSRRFGKNEATAYHVGECKPGWAVHWNELCFVLDRSVVSLEDLTSWCEKVNTKQSFSDNVAAVFVRVDDNKIRPLCVHHDVEKVVQDLLDKQAASQ